MEYCGLTRAFELMNVNLNIKKNDEKLLKGMQFLKEYKGKLTDKEGKSNLLIH